jgi:hypothetical protein
MKSEKYNRKRRVMMLIIFFLCAINILEAGKIIPVNHTSCNYTVNIPDGWDTIPNSILKEKLGSSPFNIDIGIYPVTQTDYFSGNYSLISFFPTVNMLNRFEFNQIVEDIAKMNNSSTIHNDTLHVDFENIEPVIHNNNYYVNSYFLIVNNDKSLKNCQTLYLAKFGYVSVISYEKEGAIPIKEILEQLSDMIQINPEYKYSFIEEKKGLTFKHVLISLGIGLIVYISIMFFQKLKKQAQ